MRQPPPTKHAEDENFPVGSRLIARRLRPHVAAFYAFARAADDVADDPDLAAADKLRRLDAFEAGLAGGVEEAVPRVALAMRQSLRETGVTGDHCRLLLRAFRQDVRVSRYPDWPALMGYCGLSAAPVGRYLLDLHGENDAAVPASDALCAALQILNHLQDCRRDLERLGRVYLPQDMLRRHGATEAEIAAGGGASPGLRSALDQMLALTDRLLDQAHDLPSRLGHVGLAAESATILRLARRLSDRLGRADPVAGRVGLAKRDFLMAGCGGILGTGLTRLAMAVARRGAPPRKERSPEA